MLMLAGVVWFLIYASFHFVMPVFGAMFSDFGAPLPAPTQLLFDTVGFFLNHRVVAALVALAIIFAGTEIDRRKSAAGARLYLAFAVVAFAGFVIALLLPVFQLGAVASGPS